MSIDLKTSDAKRTSANLKGFLETNSPAQLVLIDDLGKAYWLRDSLKKEISLPLLQLTSTAVRGRLLR